MNKSSNNLNNICRCLRMNSDVFQYLVEKVTPLIQKKTTHLRESIPPSEKLSVILRHLATGKIYKHKIIILKKSKFIFFKIENQIN